LEQDSPFLLATLNTIKKAKTNGFSYSDIVVLVRKNEQGTLLANYLTENSIPVISSESLLLSASSEVQFIVDFLRYLDNNSNLESKAKTLYFIAKNLQNQLPLHDFIATGMKFENENQLEQWLQQFQIQLSFQSYRKKSLYEATEIIVNKTITPLFKEGNAYVQYFLDQVLEHDFKKQTGISDFLNYWDNKINKLSIPLPEGNDAIKIMTIHKAKGLEFPVVIFPFANTNYSKSPSDKMWLNANENEIGISKTLVAKNKNVLNFGEENALIFKQKAQEELLDNINILYVALTRAEEQLYIISEQVTTNKDGNFPNTMASFFKRFLIDKNISAEEIEYEEGNPKRISKQEKNENLAQNLPQVEHLLDFKNIKIAQRESVMWNTKQQAAIEFGNTIHEILSFIKTKEDITYAIKKALENGLITSQQEQEVVNTINQIVNHPELSCYFLAENSIMNEQSIIQKNDYLIKPDRISISKNNEVFLLDYKTGLPLA
jgi:ATP-dependent exoDNAse (exonuclease V) beta subunit